jgi:hypothetical protein
MANQIQCLILTLLIAQAAQASDFWSPRTAALGGSGHAGPLLNDAIYLNPSFAALTPAYGIGVNYLMYQGTADSVYRGFNYNASVQDGSTDVLFQAGAGFTRREDASFVHIGAAKSFVRRMGFGIGTKIVQLNDGVNTRYVDGNLSVSAAPMDWLQLGFMVDNLLDNATGVARGFYREFTLGFKINIEKIVLVYIDPHWVPEVATQWGYEAGLEIPFFKDLFLRLGSFQAALIPFEAQRGGGYTLGAGWLAPKLSLDYAFINAVTPVQTQAHTFGMTVYF